MSASDDKEPRDADSTPLLRLAAEAPGCLCFGSIRLTVHDGKVMQSDLTERKRLNP